MMFLYYDTLCSVCIDNNNASIYLRDTTANYTTNPDKEAERDEKQIIYH